MRANPLPEKLDEKAIESRKIARTHKHEIRRWLEPGERRQGAGELLRVEHKGAPLDRHPPEHGNRKSGSLESQRDPLGLRNALYEKARLVRSHPTAGPSRQQYCLDIHCPSMLGRAMSKLPKRFTDFVQTYPAIGKAYRELGDAVADAGPLDPKTRQLVKIGIAIAAGLEGGVHSHVRKAIDAGATTEEIRHAVLQCVTTIGFPAMMKGMSWVEDVLASPEQS